MHKGAVFTWVGIVGGAFTVFSNLEDLIGFAKWGAWIAQVWAEAVDATVVKILDSFGLRIENFAGMMVAMAIFVSAIAIGAWLQNRISSEEAWPPRISNILNLRLLGAVALYLVYPAIIVVGTRISWLSWLVLEYPTSTIAIGHFLYVTAIVVGLRKWPASSALFVAVCMVALSYLFGNSPLHRANEPNVSAAVSASISLLSAVACGLLVVAIAPPKAFVWRLKLIMCCVLTLVAFNYVTRLGWELPPPP
ncbi:hypothetical protein [Neorhizobium sp. DAR64860/K0K1]|uniref:hypothetical protein n=1 Tax=Neorhizobium sp. DAR64860/K0K1 TaxID=3421955 RepID=UPI003D2C6FBA